MHGKSVFNSREEKDSGRNNTYFTLENQFPSSRLCGGRPGTGVPPLFGLYGDVPLDRVWFSGLVVLNRVYNFTASVLNRVRTCP